MSGAFAIDGATVRKLAARRQGRVSLGGFAYQAAYAVARLASMRVGRPILGIDGIPACLRYDWAEDLDEVDGDGRTVLTQCKRIADIAEPAELAEVLLGFAPKWLWSTAPQGESLRLRLVCCDERLSGRGPTPIAQVQPRRGESIRGDVIGAALAVLHAEPARGSDRELWQEDATALGISTLLDALWAQTEVMYLSGELCPDDPAGSVLAAERAALDLLLREQAIAPTRQREALEALRSLLHGNLVAFEPTGTALLPALDREPTVLSPDDVRRALSTGAGHAP